MSGEKNNTEAGCLPLCGSPHKRRGIGRRYLLSFWERAAAAALLSCAVYQLLDLADADRSGRPCPAF